MATVKAAQVREYGDGSGIVITDVEVGPLGPGDIEVEVAVAGIGHSDMLVVANRYQVSAPLPFVTGSEFAGTVVAVGSEVAAPSVGEQVMGTMFVGACAQRVVVPAAQVRVIPDGLGALAAIAGGVSYETAYHALRSIAEVRPGETVLVLGAGGGVGLAAVDIAGALGATVVAAASSPDKLDAARSAGATVTVDYSDEFRVRLKSAVPNGVDVVIDPVGGRWAEPALRALRPGGRFVTVGYASGEIPSIPLNLVLLKGISILGFEFRTFAATRYDEFLRNREDLVGDIASGRLQPRISGIHPLSEVAEALRSIADRRAIGKVLIDMTP